MSKAEKKHRPKKGEYGYIRNQRKREIMKTVGLFLLSLAIYLTGYRTTGTNKNLLTIVAVLGCLPASKCAVSMIMFLKSKGCDPELHDRILPHAGSLPQVYDSVLTTYEATFEVPHMVYRGSCLVGLAVNPKCNTAACEKHLRTMCTQNNIKDVNVKIFRDESKYLNRLDQLQAFEEEDEQTEAVLSLVKALSI